LDGLLREVILRHGVELLIGVLGLAGVKVLEVVGRRLVVGGA
jgi:hypothetical protein